MKKKLLYYVIILFSIVNCSGIVYAGNPGDKPFIEKKLFDSLPAPLRASFSKTSVSVCGCGKDGTVTVSVTGGTAPYIYEWSGTDGYMAGNTSSIYNLPIGYYNVSITDALQQHVLLTGIHIDFAFLVQITNSGSLSGTCGNSGSIILYGNAGIKPYTYSIDGITYQCSNTFTGLAPGTYNAYIKDLAGCTTSKPVTVGLADPLVIHPYVRPTSNCTNNGSIEIYRAGGVTPYTYSINGINFQSSNTFQNLSTGTYTCYVKDSKGCVASQPITLIQLAPLVVSARNTNTSSCINDGTIQVNPVNGGQAPYSYNLNGTTFQGANSFSGLAAGNYTVFVKDSRGCSGSVNVTINVNAVIVTPYATNASSCGATNGKIQLFRTGGFGPYTYSLDGDVYQSNNVFNNLPAGIYTGFVKDSRNCIGIRTGIVIGPANCGNTLTTVSSNKNADNKIVEKAALKVQAYPNPSVKEFNIVLEDNQSNEKIFMTVTDLAGRKVYQSEETAGKQIKFGKNLKPGMYLVTVVQGKDKKLIKVVKE